MDNSRIALFQCRHSVVDFSFSVLNISLSSPFVGLWYVEQSADRSYKYSHSGIDNYDNNIKLVAVSTQILYDMHVCGTLFKKVHWFEITDWQSLIGLVQNLQIF